jgi:hypothetical protein
MKVTRYPLRYVLSMTAYEFDALQALVQHGKADMVDEEQRRACSAGVRRVLSSARWAAIGGPLSVDVERRGRGGQAK